ncbi:MAG TPA: SIR2 family protein [Verrucomicrobiae bacterium]
MSVYASPDQLLGDPKQVKAILVDALRAGYLSVFLGAGLSMSTTPECDDDVKVDPVFPSWGELVKLVCSDSGVPFDSTIKTNDYLLQASEEAETAVEGAGQSFASVVEKALYTRCKSYSTEFLKIDLLIALGSLVMTSTRGKASAVVNYNYDDLLEWYLMLHGFTVSVVSSLPDLIPRADVVVYHPHGFLPLSTRLAAKKTGTVVLSKRSYQRVLKELDPWNEFQRFCLGCNISLFIGMSGDDPHVEWLYSSVHDDVSGGRILGVIVLMDTPLNRGRAASAKNRGIIHYYIKSHNDLPKFILELCQAAAEA